MKSIQIIPCIVSICIVCSCDYSDVHTYYCDDIDYTFKIIERDTCDVMVWGDGDSLFYSRPYNGGYCGLEFFLSVDSNIICIGPNFAPIYRYTEKKYRIKFIEMDLTNEDVYAQYRDYGYWGFYGGCDQDRYTFGVSHDSIYQQKSLEPLEWN